MINLILLLFYCAGIAMILLVAGIISGWIEKRPFTLTERRHPMATFRDNDKGHRG